MSFVPLRSSATSPNKPITYPTETNGNRGVVRVVNGISHNLKWIGAIDERNGTTVQPFNRTARLKQPCWQTEKPANHEATNERPKPVGTFNDGSLFFKPDMSPPPHDVVSRPDMSPTHVPVVHKLNKLKKLKKSKKDKKPVVFSSTPKAGAKLLLVRQKSVSGTKIRIKKKAVNGFLYSRQHPKKKLEGWLNCDDCEAVLPPLDMKVHYKRFHLEVECPDCYCHYVGEQRLSEHICRPNDETRLMGMAKERTRRNPVVSPPNSRDFHFMSGDELISSARSVTDDERDYPDENGLMNLTEFVDRHDTRMMTRPTTPTRIIRNDSCWTRDFDLDFTDVSLCSEVREATFVTSSPAKEVPQDMLPKLPDVPNMRSYANPAAMVSYVVRHVEDLEKPLVYTTRDRANPSIEKNPSSTSESSMEVTEEDSCGSLPGVNIGDVDDDSDYLDLPTP